MTATAEETDRWFSKAASNAQDRAKRFGVPFGLYTAGSPEGFSAAVVRLIDMARKTPRCPVFPWLGTLLYERSEGKGQARDNTASLDRIRPDLGYVWGNVRWISWRANNIRSNGTSREFRALALDLDSVKPTTAANEPMQLELTHTTREAA